MRTFRRLIGDRSLTVAYLYGTSVLANLAAGALLAHLLSVYNRGAVANASVLTSVAVIVATLGLPEYLLVRDGHGLLRRRTRQVVGTVIVPIAILTAVCVRLLVPTTSPAAMVFLVMLVALSCMTAFQTTRIQLKCGVVVANIVRTSHIVVLGIGQTVGAIVRPADPGVVYAAWFAAEVITLSAAVVVGRANAGERSSFNIVEWRSSLQHASAQVGNFLADRGLITLAALLSSVSLSAYVAVCSSAMTAVALPVYAYAPKILRPAEGNEAEPAPVAIARTRRIATVGVVVCGALALLTYHFLIVFLFGSQYRPLADQFVMVTAGGCALAAWRYSHLVLRRDRRPGVAAASDAVAAIVVVVLLLVADSAGHVPVILTAYFVTGFAVTTALRWARRGTTGRHHDAAVVRNENR